jgi:hypothetical protein
MGKEVVSGHDEPFLCLAHVEIDIVTILGTLRMQEELRGSIEIVLPRRSNECIYICK